MNEILPVPDAVKDDENAVELVRAWVASGDLHIAVATGLWKDPAAWGIMIVDLAKHVARAYETEEGKDYEHTLLRIKSGFDAEWGSPTD